MHIAALMWHRPTYHHAGDYEQRSMGLIKRGGAYVSVLAAWSAWSVVKG